MCNKTTPTLGGMHLAQQLRSCLGAPISHAGTPQVELGIRFCPTACTLRGNNDGSSTLVPTSNVGNPV